MNSRGKLVAVAAAAAVVIGLTGTGTAVARSLVGSKDIKDGSIRMVDLNQAVVDAISQAGPAGPQGPQGPQGTAGPQGETGPRGERGLRGFSGADGTDGEDGEDGTDGQDGRDAGISFTGDSTTVAPQEGVFVTASCLEGSDPQLQVYAADNQPMVVTGTRTTVTPGVGTNEQAIFDDSLPSYVWTWNDQTQVVDLTLVPATGNAYELQVVFRAGQPCQGQGVLIPIGARD